MAFLALIPVLPPLAFSQDDLTDSAEFIPTDAYDDEPFSPADIKELNAIHAPAARAEMAAAPNQNPYAGIPHDGRLTAQDFLECHALYELGKERLAAERAEIRTELLEEFAERRADAEKRGDSVADIPDLAAPENAQTFHDLVEAELLDRVQENLLAKKNAHGRVEIKSMAGGKDQPPIIFFRVVHDRADESVIYSDTENYLEELKSFNVYAAGTFHVARKNLTHVTMDAENGPVKIAAHLRPTSIFQLRHWTSYFRYVLAAPTKADAAIGGFCNAFEMGLMACIVDIPQVMSGVLDEMPVASYGVKVFFGVTVGMVLGRSFVRWTEVQPSKVAKWKLKLSTVLKRSSLSFAMGVAMMWASQAEGLSSLALTSWKGAAAWSLMLTNMFISNLVKDEVQDWVVKRSELRMNTGSKHGDITIPLPFWPITMKRSRKMAENSVLRMFTGLLRYADLTLSGTVSFAAMTLQDYVPGVPGWLIGGATFTASRAAYASLTLVPMWFNLRYFKKHLAKAQLEAARRPNSQARAQRVENFKIAIAKLEDRQNTTWRVIKAAPKWVLTSPWRFLDWITDHIADKLAGTPADLPAATPLQVLEEEGTNAELVGAHQGKPCESHFDQTGS